jgi:hypothetical protein
VQTISLTSEELASCYAAAQERIEHSRSHGCKDRRGYKPGADELQIETRSFAAELAVTKSRNLPPQTGIGRYGVPDVEDAAWLIDVKSSRSPFLHVEPAKLHHDWFYCLCKVVGPFVLLWGYVSGEEIARYNDLVDYSNGRTPVLRFPASGLHPTLEGSR